MGDSGELESWEFQGGTFTATGSWLAVGGKKVAELERETIGIPYTIKGYYRVGNQGEQVVDIDTPITGYGDYISIKVRCKEGDKFIVTASGGNESRPFSFISEDGTNLYCANQGVAAENQLLIAPENSYWFISSNNNEKVSNPEVISGNRSDIVEIEQEVSTLQQEVGIKLKKFLINKFCYVTKVTETPNINFSTTEKTININIGRAQSISGISVIGGSGLNTTISYAGLTGYLGVIVVKQTEAKVLDKIEDIEDDYYILGLFRNDATTISGIYTNVYSYSIDGEIYYNQVDETRLVPQGIDINVINQAINNTQPYINGDFFVYKDKFVNKTDGSVNASGYGAMTTDFIPFKKGDTLSASGLSSAGSYNNHVQYNENKIAVKQGDSSSVLVLDETNTDENCAFVRLNSKSDLSPRLEINGIKDLKTLTKDVEKGSNRLYNILIIGNSYSANGSNYMPIIARYYGQKVYVEIIGHSGCSLKNNWEGRENPDYADIHNKFDNTTDSGFVNILSSSENKTIQQVLQSKKWDYVIVHQHSSTSMDSESFNPYVQNFKDYVAQYSRAEYTELGLQLTWAYGKNEYHTGEGYYPFDGTSSSGNPISCTDQLDFYNQVVKNYKAASEGNNIPLVIPAGVAVQLARQNNEISSAYNGLNTENDYIHINNQGSFIASLVWFYKLFGKLLGLSALDFDGGASTVISVEYLDIVNQCVSDALRDTFKEIVK